MKKNKRSLQGGAGITPAKHKAGKLTTNNNGVEHDSCMDIDGSASHGESKNVSMPSIYWNDGIQTLSMNVSKIILSFKCL